MKQVKRWQSDDGAIWRHKKDAIARDVMIDSISWFEVVLPPVEDDSCSFANGDGYVQHDASVVVDAKERLLKLTEGVIGWWFKSQREKYSTDFNTVDPSWFLRMMDGSAPPLEHAWQRLSCIDKSYREWGQPYYAMNPTKGKQVVWKP